MTLATMLAMILLSVSYASSACEIQCDLRSLQNSCHGAHPAGSLSNPSAQSQMAGMPHCGMDKAHPQDFSISIASGGCHQTLCIDQAAIPIGKRAASSDLVLHRQMQTLLFPAPAPTFDPFSRVFEKRPHRIPSPVSLHTTIRT